MKRVLLVVLLAVFGLLIYATCTDKSQTSRKALFQRTTSEGLPINRDNWALFLPGKDWIVSQSGNPQIELTAQNDRLAMLFMIAIEPADETFESYVVGNVRTINSLGGKLLSADLVSINGNQFFAVALNNPTVWIWIATKNGLGYGLTCGGDTELDAGSLLRYRCQEIANSFLIKE